MDCADALLGREVVVLLDGAVSAGEQAIRWSANHMPSGVYVALLETNAGTMAARLTLLR